MYGRNPIFPFEAEVAAKAMDSPICPDEASICEHVEQICKLQEKLFPIVGENIKAAQQKQEIQYKNKRTLVNGSVQNGTEVLRRNMLQKTKMGHKMEDNWIGPYTVVDLNKEKGTCKLKDKHGKLLKKQISLKQLKLYQKSVVPSAQVLSESAISSSLEHATAIPQPNQPQPEMDQPQPEMDQHMPEMDQPQPEMDHDQHMPEMMSSSESSDNPFKPDICMPPSPVGSTAASFSDEEKDHNGELAKMVNCIKALSEGEISQHLFFIIPDLKKIMGGSIQSWRYELATTGKCQQYPELKQKDLPYNTVLSGVEEDQCYLILQHLKVAFPDIKDSILVKALLPEAVHRFCARVLDIPLCDIINCYSKKIAETNAVEQLNIWSKKGGKRGTSAINHSAKKLKRSSPTDDVVFISERKNTSTPEHMKRPEFGILTKNDHNTITGSGALTDIHIMKAQSILHQQFPLLDGFLSTALGIAGQFPIMQSNFVQILHTNKFHWVCVSNIGIDRSRNNHADINLYDSLYRTITIDEKKQIAALLFSRNKKVDVVVNSVQQQVNSVDCGVFAIVFATSLCLGLDPCALNFRRREIRNHLWECLANESFTMFPHTKSTRSPPGRRIKASFDIHCTCRQPWEPEKKMVQCDSCLIWYHQICEGVPDAFFRNSASKSWICSTCKA